MASDTQTREGLATYLIQRISIAEKKDLAATPRDYTLDLVRDVFAAIDGTRKPGAMKISPEALERSRG